MKQAKLTFKTIKDYTVPVLFFAALATLVIFGVVAP